MNNLPIEKDESFFGKIKNFFRRLFWKNDNKTQEKQPVAVIKKEPKNNFQPKQDFEENIKVEVKNDFIEEKKREDFLNEIEKNPSLLYELPIEKLEILEEYYKKSIEKYEQKLDKMKKVS